MPDWNDPRPGEAADMAAGFLEHFGPGRALEEARAALAAAEGLTAHVRLYGEVVRILEVTHG